MILLDLIKPMKSPTTPPQPTPSSDQSTEIRTLDPINPAMLSNEEALREEAWASWEARMDKEFEGEDKIKDKEAPSPSETRD